VHCSDQQRWLAGRQHYRLSRSFIPPTTITNAAALLNRAQIGLAQTIIFHRVFACGLQTILRDGSTYLIALIG
jgi:hypothetical protein